MLKIRQAACLLALLIGLSSPCLELEAKERWVNHVSKREELEEKILGEMELIAFLVRSEAGNQDLTGKRLVVDVVLNRVDSDQFPDTIEGVIFQKGQFTVVSDGTYWDAPWYMTEDDYKAVELEYKERMDQNILFFSTKKSKYAKHHYKHQDHWFGW